MKKEKWFVYVLVMVILSCSSLVHAEPESKSLLELLQDGITYDIDGTEVTVRLDMEEVERLNLSETIEAYDKEEVLAKIEANTRDRVEELQDSEHTEVTITEEPSTRAVPEQEGARTVRQERYRIAELGPGLRVEYVAVSTMRLGIMYSADADAVPLYINRIISTGFTCESMDSPGSFSDVSISANISNSKASATMVTNYVVNWDQNIDYTLPLHYEVNMTEEFTYEI